MRGRGRGGQTEGAITRAEYLQEVSQCGEVLATHLLCRGVSREGAEEAVQEAITLLLETNGYEQFDPQRASFVTWMQQIVWHRHLNLQRHERTLARYETACADETPRQEEPPTLSWEEALNQEAPEPQALVRAVILQGYSIRELAQRSGKPAALLSRQLKEALWRIHRRLEE